MEISGPILISTSKPASPTSWQQFRHEPALFLAQWLYARLPKQPVEAKTTKVDTLEIAIVCISDTHCTEPEVPPGDLLIHAGDLTNQGDFASLQKQLDWLNSLPHKHKIVIGGNHDRLLDADYVARFPERIHEGEGTSQSDLQWGSLIYLNNASTTLSFDNERTISVYGSPITPDCGSFAFQYPPIRQVWKDAIPANTDILVTHGPPKGHLDLGGKGCPQLLQEIRRARPRLVVFGHIHEGHGEDRLVYHGARSTRDKILSADGGIFTVFAMTIFTALSWILQPIRRAFGIKQSRQDGTLLVNAAIGGGPGDMERRKAQVVTI